MIRERVYRCEKFLRDGKVERSTAKRWVGFDAALAEMNRILSELHNVSGESCRITCVGSGEFKEYAMQAGEWKIQTDTFLKAHKEQPS